MPPKTRHRSRSSVDHVFELVEGLDESQLQLLLDEINSTVDGNIEVAKGVEYFERPKQPKEKPPLVEPPEQPPKDWPKNRPVSWRHSRRMSSLPFQFPPPDPKPAEPFPVDPDGSRNRNSDGRRVVTAPVDRTLELEADRQQTLPRSGTFGREKAAYVARWDHARRESCDDHDSLQQTETSQRVSAATFGVGSGQSETARPSSVTDLPVAQPQQDPPPPPQLGIFEFVEPNPTAISKPEIADPEDDVPFSRQFSFMQADPAAQAAQPSRPTSPPTVQQPEMKRAQAEPMSLFEPMAPRPKTATGDRASQQPRSRSYKRISRPLFLAPGYSSPDDLARQLSAYFFGGAGALTALSSGSSSMASPTSPQSMTRSTTSELDDLMEPATPRAQAVFGPRETEMPKVAGIFEVLDD